MPTTDLSAECAGYLSGGVAGIPRTAQARWPNIGWVAQSNGQERGLGPALAAADTHESIATHEVGTNRVAAPMHGGRRHHRPPPGSAFEVEGAAGRDDPPIDA